MTSLMTIQCPENIMLVKVDYLRNVIFTRYTIWQRSILINGSFQGRKFGIH